MATFRKNNHLRCTYTIGDVLRIVNNKAIAVEGAVGQSPRPNQITSLTGSGIKMEGNHQKI